MEIIQIPEWCEEQISWGTQECPQNPQQAEYEGTEEKDKAIKRTITAKSLPHSGEWKRVSDEVQEMAWKLRETLFHLIMTSPNKSP